MNYDYVKRLVRMIVVLIAQVLLLNHMHLLGYATPIFLGYMIMPFKRGTNRVELLFWGFFTGLIFDMFSNTAGMGAGSLTLLAMMQPSLLNLFVPNDAAEDFAPTIRVIGFWKYTLYSLMGMSIVNVMFYALDAFSIANWQLTLSAIGISTLTATFLCIVAELMITERN